MNGVDGRQTELLDLSDISLQELPDQPVDSLERYLTILYGQVERPRYNLGSSPPGRVD